MTILTDTQLAAIRERAEKATAGPWIYAPPTHMFDSCIVKGGENGGKVIAYSPRSLDSDQANIRMCAHARTDVPALLETVDALKEEAEKQYLLGLEHGSARIKGECDILLEQAKADKAKADALRGALAPVSASPDNEGTAFPWWAICVYLEGFPGQPVVKAGPFFSRGSAEDRRQARLYHYGEQSFVYCFSGHESREFKELYQAAALKGGA